RELGVAGYLTKPVGQNELLEALRRVLATTLDPSAHEEVVTRHTIREDRPALEVLLAEDTPVNRMVAARMLERMGHRVTLANNGQEAVEAAATGTFDVILMDVQLPVMDGFEATARILESQRAHGTSVP